MSLAQSITRAVRGDWHGIYGLVPGLNHSPHDRSMSVMDSDGGDDVVLHSYAGDDWRPFKDDLRAKGLLPSRTFQPATISPRPRLAPTTDHSAGALALWQQSVEPADTLVDLYLASRGLKLPDNAIDVLRFHPACPFGKDVRLPCMVALMRDVVTGEPRAIHRTALTPDARKIDRKMLGPARGTAIMFSFEVGAGLGVAEGIETALSVYHAGWWTVWALGSAGAIATMSVLPHSTLTVFADADAAGQEAAMTLAGRWVETGQQAFIQTPPRGDFNDVTKEAAHG